MPSGVVILLRFVAGAVMGCLLLVVVAMLEGVITLAIYRHTHPGIGAVAGGVSGAAVILVPVLSGAIAVLMARRNRLKR